MTELQINVNGSEHEVDVDPAKPLAQVLHEDLEATGTKQSCSTGICGACTVRIDGEARKSCLHMAGKVTNSEILTIEGLTPSRGSGLHPIQKAFVDKFAFQCGFCTPGFIMSTAALLDESPDPSEEEIKDKLHGNICRCTGYVSIVEGVQEAARRMNDE